MSEEMIRPRQVVDPTATPNPERPALVVSREAVLLARLEEVEAENQRLAYAVDNYRIDLESYQKTITKCNAEIGALKTALDRALEANSPKTYEGRGWAMDDLDLRTRIKRERELFELREQWMREREREEERRS